MGSNDSALTGEEIQTVIVGTLPSIKAAPSIRAVYFLIDRGRVVYVGQTTHLMQRVIAHHAEGTKTFDDVRYLEMPEGNLNLAEREFIVKLQPKYNSAKSKTAGEVYKNRSINRTTLTATVSQKSR